MKMKKSQFREDTATYIVLQKHPITSFSYSITEIRRIFKDGDYNTDGNCRGQEPSRGHIFSILENFLPLWDSFLLGRACPKPCCLLSENHAPLGPRELTLIGGTEL